MMFFNYTFPFFWCSIHGALLQNDHPEVLLISFLIIVSPALLLTSH
jgi:hypothetical protein